MGKKVDVRKKRRKSSEAVLKIMQGKGLSRNNEEGMQFRAVVLNICYCSGSFIDGRTVLTVIAFNAQNDSQGGTGEQFTDISESQLQK